MAIYHLATPDRRTTPQQPSNTTHPTQSNTATRIWPPEQLVFPSPYNFLQTVGYVLLLTTLSLSHSAQAATHPADCDIPSSFDPLFGLLDTLATVAFVAGISIGLLGLLTASLFIMLPGEDNTRKGKKVAKATIFGIVLLLSANMIVDFLLSEMGVALC